MFTAELFKIAKKCKQTNKNENNPNVYHLMNGLKHCSISIQWYTRVLQRKSQ